ncbi:hypothetical protein QE418_003364 [Microbacterium testaceum]|uniref:hypothetical protein n=1 Tax=Microbacterium TaxID=33882 RepID=UPI0027846C31|nr:MULTISPECIES: hypothetical protein [Microbacterium]MDQ1113916.1 hypothetical protein [Microbacterium testaceum]MDR6098977.1 hypothetical protein [Microbacterium sp. SORGH_AS_0454]
MTDHLDAEDRATVALADLSDVAERTSRHDPDFDPERLAAAVDRAQRALDEWARALRDLHRPNDDD